jgi:hypothetical protein
MTTVDYGRGLLWLEDVAMGCCDDIVDGVDDDKFDLRTV